MRDYKLNIPDPRFLCKWFKSSYDFTKPVYFRGSFFPFDSVGKKLYVHDGRSLTRFFFIKFEHLDYKLGSFVFTKSTGYSIHTNKGKKSKKAKLYFFMITNKSTTIRFGLSQNWPVAYSSRRPSVHQTYLSLHDFISSFFSDFTFRSRGVIFSHTLVRGSIKKLEIHNFLQDAKIVDFVNTFPRRSLFSQLNKSFTFSSTVPNSDDRFWLRRQSNFNSAKFKKFIFRRQQIFFSPRSYNLLGDFHGNRPNFYIFNNYLYSKYFTLFSRAKRSKRYGRSKQTHFCNFFNYFSAHRSFRLRYFSFLIRLFAHFFYTGTKTPIFLNMNHLVPRHTTAHFYLNYICTKLYYRYILNDVVNPVVRMSLRCYRGFSINCKGRFTRAQMASQKNYTRGSMSFSSLTNSIDYAQQSVTLKYGTCNLKLWIRK